MNSLYQFRLARKNLIRVMQEHKHPALKEMIGLLEMLEYGECEKIRYDWNQLQTAIENADAQAILDANLEKQGNIRPGEIKKQLPSQESKEGTSYVSSTMRLNFHTMFLNALALHIAHPNDKANNAILLFYLNNVNYKNSIKVGFLLIFISILIVAPALLSQTMPDLFNLTWNMTDPSTGTPFIFMHLGHMLTLISTAIAGGLGIRQLSDWIIRYHANVTVQFYEEMEQRFPTCHGNAIGLPETNKLFSDLRQKFIRPTFLSDAGQFFQKVQDSVTGCFSSSEKKVVGPKP